jgi:putative endonuclease
MNMNEIIPCVYILANKKNGTIYVGVTSDVRKRIWQHKNGIIDGFTKRYHVHMLVYFEVCPSMLSAIEREKQIKGGSRKKKIALIEYKNPEWNDLFDDMIKNG